MTQIYETNWQGTHLTITCDPDYSIAYRTHYGQCLAYIRLSTFDDKPLPISEIGQYSTYLPFQFIANAGGPIAYVRQWLNSEALRPHWRNSIQRSAALKCPAL